MTKTLTYIRPYSATAVWGIIVKFIGSIAELFLPLLLDYIIDDVVPLGDMTAVLLLGLAMLVFSLVAMFGNIIANRLSVRAAARMTHDLRYDLFSRISYLKSGQVDAVTVPSLVSRLTSDSYYVNQMVARTLRLGVRAPILLVGGIIMTFVVVATFLFRLDTVTLPKSSYQFGVGVGHGVVIGLSALSIVETIWLYQQFKKRRDH